MPATEQPIQPTPIDLNTTPSWLFRNDPITNDQARATVMQAFTWYESRRTPQEGLWTLADSLYNGVVEARKWDGSNVLRSHLPNNIAFDHVEGAMSLVCSALFDNPEWFSVEAMEHTSPQDARDAQAILQYFVSIPDELTYLDPIVELKQAIRTLLMYGTGFIELEWIANKPRFKWVDIRNVYIDPATPGCVIGKARNLIVREMKTIEEMQEIARSDSRIELPPLPVLHALADSMPFTNADAVKTWANLARGIPYSPPGDDWQPLPKNRFLELLKYYEDGRVIWVLGRTYPIFMEENPYQFKPIFAAPCRDVHAQFYGIGMPEAIRWPQRYSEALRNNHIDEMHLAMNPMKIIGMDTGTNHSDLNTRPGLTHRTSKPREAQVIAPPGITLNVSGEIADIENLAAKRNGISDISIGGTGKPGQYRTAAGVNAQSAGTNVRLKQIAENIEDYLLKPLLYGMRKLIQFHTRPEDVLIGAYPDAMGGQTVLKPLTAAVMHKPLMIKIECASKMLTRDRLLQLLEPVGRTLINGPVMQGLAQTGMKVNAAEFAQMIQDAGGLTKRYALVIPMTDEEKQQMNQPPPQVIAAQQKAQQDAQLRSQATQAKFQADRERNQTQLQIAAMANQPNPFEAQAKQQDSMLKQKDMEQKLAANERTTQMKLQAQAQKQQMDMQAKAAELNLKQYEMAMKAREMDMNQRLQVQQHFQQSEMMRQQHAQTLDQDRQMGDEKRRQMVEDARIRQQTQQRPQNERVERR